jgi:hypothetical protein
MQSIFADVRPFMGPSKTTNAWVSIMDFTVCRACARLADGVRHQTSLTFPKDFNCLALTSR